MHCRAIELAPSVIPSIPDGNNGRHICTCLFKSNRVSFTGSDSKSLAMQVNGWIPVPLLFSTLSTGVLLDGFSIGTFLAPGGVAPEFTTGTDSATRPGITFTDPYNATHCRIIAITVNITYTGPTLSTAGVIRVTSNSQGLLQPITITSTSSVGTPPVSGVSLGIPDGSTVIGYAPINTIAYSLEGAAGTSSVQANTVTLRPEEGCTIRLKHRTNDFKMVPLTDNGLGVVTTSTTSTPGGPVVLTNAISAFNGYGGAIKAFDNDWEGVHVLFENVNADGSFLIDTCVCIEAQPSIRSSLYKFAKESVKPNLPDIAATQEYINNNMVKPHRD
jgi:hypothetical protein